VLVVDASVIAPAVADAGADGAAFRHRLRGETIAAPDLLGVEVVSVLRRQVAASLITPSQASAAVDDLLDLPLSVFPTAPLLPRAWQLQDDLAPYDACYAALAEALDCTLLTADTRLTNAPGARCTFESA
jgi:predicted nucleic acid-binding protein